MTSSRTSQPLQLSATLKLYDQFKKDFSFKLATSEEEKRRVYRLRYEVYCQEIGYHTPITDTYHIEKDSHEGHSIHCLLQHNSSGLDAGCMRLVLPNPKAKSPEKRLPLQEIGGRSLTHDVLNPSTLPADSICEISRFAIARPFRRRAINHETDTIPHHFSQEEKRTFPLIIVGLFLATYSLVGLTGRRHVFAMMESRLPRLLAMSGFNFTQVGDPIELHGRRSAFYIDHRQAEKEIHEDLMPLYLYIRDELASQMVKEETRQDRCFQV